MESEKKEKQKITELLKKHGVTKPKKFKKDLKKLGYTIRTENESYWRTKENEITY